MTGVAPLGAVSHRFNLIFNFLIHLSILLDIGFVSCLVAVQSDRLPVFREQKIFHATRTAEWSGFSGDLLISAQSHGRPSWKISCETDTNTTSEATN